MWNELFNISVLACIGLLILYFLFFDREKFKNKLLVGSFISFFAGFILFYCVGDFFGGSSIETHTYNIYDKAFDNLKLFSFFFKKFTFYTFFIKRGTWLLILFSLIFIKFQKIQKINKYFLILSIFILFGYVFCNFIQIFVNNLITGEGINYPFERNSYNFIELNLLEFVFLVLLGIIYNFSKCAKKIIISIFLIIVIFLSYFFQADYFYLISKKFYEKSLLFKIERATLFYNILGESVILPAGYLYLDPIRWNKIFIMHDKFLYIYIANFEVFIKNKYFDDTYSLYASYYNHNYKNKFIGFRYVDNEYYQKEMLKRLQLFDKSLENEINSKKNKFIKVRKQRKDIKFKDLKDFEKKLTLNDIEKLNFTEENKYLLNKIKGYIYFKDNDLDNALKYYELYLKSEPNDFDALINCAKIYTLKKDYKKAVEVYKKLINMDSNNLMFKFNYFDILYSKENNYKEALNVSDDILKLNTRGVLIPNSYLYKALVYKELKNYTEAKKYYELYKEKDFRSFSNFSKENEINSFQDFINLKKSLLPEPYFFVPREYN